MAKTMKNDTVMKKRMGEKIPGWHKRMTKLVRDYGSRPIAEVTVEQLYGGIRNVPVQVSDISFVDPQTGIRLRGYNIAELLNLLPKAKDSEYPLTGGLYFLLMADEFPSEEEAIQVEQEWQRRSELPGYIFDLLKALPATTHPMTMFSLAILAMHNESVFSPRYIDGIAKSDYWDAYLEDSLNLTAKLPSLAAYIYNLKYRNGEYIAPNPDLDWAANFAHMIGKGDDPEYQEFCRLYFCLLADHEGGNVSAHTSYIVASALADVYYAVSAGMDGLAGPLHGLANEDCLRWLLEVRKNFDKMPTLDEVRQYAVDYLKSGRVIPGYGHAVLRVTDPRFMAQLKFGKRYLPEDELFCLADEVFQTVPDVLAGLGKIKSPWPNVDAMTGAIQYHYGITQIEFYTVLFGISRSLGLTTHAVWCRALGRPIERPKSLTTRILEQMVSE
ncbi:MAG TPA: citrate (Si)-synthase [Longilinea sp.]|nr:citrate (Si)-synthase [Longilinea sp.]